VNASTPEADWDRPPRRRGRRLIGPIALAASVALVAALVIWGGGGHTPAARGVRLHNFSTMPPYPDVAAQPVARKTRLAAPDEVFVVAQGTLADESFRIVAWVSDGHPCFASDDHLRTFAPTCLGAVVPSGAEVVSDRPAPSIGGITVGVAGPTVVAVRAEGPDGRRVFAPALRLPGTQARIWTVLDRARSSKWMITAYDTGGGVVGNP
jgi:hypothetical protein